MGLWAALLIALLANAVAAPSLATSNITPSMCAAGLATAFVACLLDTESVFLDGLNVEISVNGEDTVTLVYDLDSACYTTEFTFYEKTNEVEVFVDTELFLQTNVETYLPFTTVSELDLAADRGASGSASLIITSSSFLLVADAQNNRVVSFSAEGAAWGAAQVLEPSNGDGAGFGTAVALHGEALLIGAPEDSTEAIEGGALFFFRHDGAAWQSEQTIYSRVASNGAHFGAAAALEGPSFVVGAPDKENGGVTLAGAAFFFEFGEFGWQVSSEIARPAASYNECFGARAQLSGGLAALAGNTRVWLFGRDAGAWAFQRVLTSSSQAPRILLSGETLAVGRPFLDAVDFFAFDGAQWTNGSTATGPAGSFFGGSLSFSSGALCVGAPADSRGSSQGGSVSVFHAHPYRGGWFEARRMLALEAAAGFGASSGFAGGALVASTAGGALYQFADDAEYISSVEAVFADLSTVSIAAFDRDGARICDQLTVVAAFEGEGLAATSWNYVTCKYAYIPPSIPANLAAATFVVGVRSGWSAQKINIFFPTILGVDLSVEVAPNAAKASASVTYSAVVSSANGLAVQEEFGLEAGWCGGAAVATSLNDAESAFEFSLISPAAAGVYALCFQVWSSIFSEATVFVGVEPVAAVTLVAFTPAAPTTNGFRVAFQVLDLYGAVIADERALDVSLRAPGEDMALQCSFDAQAARYTIESAQPTLADAYVLAVRERGQHEVLSASFVVSSGSPAAVAIASAEPAVAGLADFPLAFSLRDQFGNTAVCTSLSSVEFAGTAYDPPVCEGGVFSLRVNVPATPQDNALAVTTSGGGVFTAEVSIEYGPAGAVVSAQTDPTAATFDGFGLAFQLANACGVVIPTERPIYATLDIAYISQTLTPVFLPASSSYVVAAVRPPSCGNFSLLVTEEAHATLPAAAVFVAPGAAAGFSVSPWFGLIAGEANVEFSLDIVDSGGHTLLDVSIGSCSLGGGEVSSMSCDGGACAFRAHVPTDPSANSVRLQLDSGGIFTETVEIAYGAAARLVVDHAFGEKNKTISLNVTVENAHGVVIKEARAFRVRLSTWKDYEAFQYDDSEMLYRGTLHVPSRWNGSVFVSCGGVALSAVVGVDDPVLSVIAIVGIAAGGALTAATVLLFFLNRRFRWTRRIRAHRARVRNCGSAPASPVEVSLERDPTNSGFSQGSCTPESSAKVISVHETSSEAE
eukprot:gnl/Chilomastix_cuspidata/5744.p1 GENE.gnl/Chilomastix_cuspidata/5744~~gnl/Chilomastix_cuspidata/5744.p1  ORF type:complete len:1222 (+),score=415.70 gnl/Chilomastix_cuspidata/5744:50-3667(+)